MIFAIIVVESCKENEGSCCNWSFPVQGTWRIISKQDPRNEYTAGRGEENLLCGVH